MTTQPDADRRGLNARHLSFLAHLLTVADEAGVAVVYCCYNNGWGIMTSPKLDDEAGTAFLAALEVGEVGEPTQSDPRVIVAGREYSGNAVRLYVQPLTVSTDTPIEAAP